MWGGERGSSRRGGSITKNETAMTGQFLLGVYDQGVCVSWFG